MGEVYRARDTRLDRTVAVKILPAALAADPQLRERFEREARAISQLTHANICRLYDVGRSEVRGPEGLRHIPTDETGATFQFGKPSPLFDLVNEAQPSPNRHYDVTPDGARFVVIKDPQTATSLQLVVVEHWLEELKARVPVAK